MKRRLLMLFLLGVGAVGTHAQTLETISQFISTSLMEDGKAIRLELLVRKPPGPGPFPTVVFNHGSTGRGDNPELFRRSWTSWRISRGWFDAGLPPMRNTASCVVCDNAA